MYTSDLYYSSINLKRIYVMSFKSFSVLIVLLKQHITTRVTTRAHAKYNTTVNYILSNLI